MNLKDLSGLAEKAATDLNVSAEPVEPAAALPVSTPAAEPPKATTAAPSETPKASVTPAPTSAPATPSVDKKALLESLRGAIERKEIEPEELSFVNQKLQSSFSKLKSVQKAVADRVQEALDDAGVTLPDGTTVSDVMNTPDGGKSFGELIRGHVRSEMKPFVEAKSQEALREEITGHFESALTANPEIQEYLPQIGAAIKEQPLLERAIAIPEYIPLVMLGVARDFQWQKEKGRADRLETENAQLKEVIAAAQEVKEHGTITSRAASTPAPATTGGAPKNIRAMAESLFDAAVAKSAEHVN